METIPDTLDFDSYFDRAFTDDAKIKPASEWCDGVISCFYGDESSANWAPIGFRKAEGNFDLREGELTLWAGINGHGKTTFLSHVILNAIYAGQKACLASLEMPPKRTMAKMTRQAASSAKPTEGYIRAFHDWTNGRLWIYDHVGRVDAQRMLGVAAYVRNELGINHLVIDSLMKCGLGTDDYTGQKDFVDSLQTFAAHSGLHIHLVCHMRKGESEMKAPDKMDVKGASEIADIADNVVIVWKNKPKHDALEKARTIREIDLRDAAVAEQQKKPDAFVRVTKQRHFEWEGSMAFWFDAPSQQFTEGFGHRLTCVDLPVDMDTPRPARASEGWA